MSHLSAALAGVDNDGWGHVDNWGGGWMWWWGIATMSIFVVLIVWLIRSTAGGQGQVPRRDPTDRAREILAERDARGELTSEEYRERVDQLR